MSMCISTAQARTKCRPRLAPGSIFSWQAQYCVDFGKKVAETRNLLVTLCVCVCVGWLVLWRGDNLISLSRNPLGTLCGSDRSGCSALRILTWLVQPSPYIVCVCVCVSDCSRCGALWILTWLPQTSRDFVCGRSLLLWRGADFSWISFRSWPRDVLSSFARSFYDDLGSVSWCSLRGP